MATNYHSQRSVSASSIDSGGGTVTSSSRPAAADTNSSALSKRLDALLSSGGRGEGEDGRDGVADDGEFSVPGYLNLALTDDAENLAPNDFAADEDDGALQTRMAELALQLQIETQRCHDDIEKIGMEVRAALPRAEADVARLGVGLDGMRQDAAGLLRDSAPFVVEDATSPSADGVAEERRDDGATPSSSKTGEGGGDGKGGRPPPPLETLSTLHALRTNLGLTKSILSAASSWDATVTRIPALLSPPSASTDTTNLPPAASPSSPTAGGNTTVANLSEATQALITLRHGSRALRGMPGREEREATIEDFQSRIEVLLKPRLLHALQTGVSNAGASTSGGPLQQIADTYKLLGRTDTLVEEYVRARPAAVHRSWFAFVSPVPGGGLGGADGGGDDDEEEEDIPVGVGEDDDDYYRDRDAEARKREARERRGRERERERLEAFVGWLPGWYDGVAALLSEERRRSAAVFGPDAAPEIVARVLGECFRPLLSSFSTRLSALFPPDADASQPSSGGGGVAGGGGGGGSTTSFEAVCAAYESTLRFLSLAYDPMLGAPTSAVRDAFASVASPFAPYQRNLAALELRHSGEAAAAVSRDVQAAGRLGGGGAAGAAGLTALQNAVDRLAELSTLVFPLADAALSRFELLNCGYNTQAALSTIDTLITNHISELAITIGTLSATMTDDGDALAKAFDEQHVHCALEVLRMAGSFVRSLDAFERRTRDRLRNMCTGMRASVAQMEGEEGGGAGADSLSIVEVGALLARSVCEGEASSSSSSSRGGGGGDKVAAIAQLQRLSGESRPGSASRRRSSQLPDLLPSSRGASVRLAGTCHGFVFDVLYAVPRMWLRDVSSLPVWREGGRGGGGGEAALDSYSILPQQYITQVGEHILALVQALEPFASNGDALALANEVMNGVEEVAVQPWKELVGAAGCSDAMKEDDAVVGDLMKGKELKKFLLSQGDDSFDLGHEEDDEGDDASAKFCNEWLSVVGSAVSGRVLERVLRIPKLSAKGGGNLVADLNYLVNVFSALGISGHPHPLLNHFGSSIAMDGAELRQMIDAKSGETDELARTICAMEMRIAAMRGIEIRG